MNRLSYVKTDSYVSLVDLEEEETPEVEPPVFVFGVDCHGAYLRHKKADVPTGGEIFVERRINSADSPAMTLLRLECGGRSSSEYLIILDTNHQAFSRPRSSVLRSLNSFYYLSSILKKDNPLSALPSLPVKLHMWVLSSQQRLSVLSAFLARILSEEDFLSNKTGKSVEEMQQNIDGPLKHHSHEQTGNHVWSRMKKLYRKSS